MPTSMLVGVPHDHDAATVLTRYADAVAAGDWDGLAALLSPGFVARLLHTGETFGREGFVAFNRDYPGPWTVHREDVVATGDRGVLRTRVVAGAEVYHAASFATLDADGLLAELVEVWTDAVPAEGTGRPHARPTTSG